MKILFLIYHGFADYNGISKKIFAQADAMRQNGAQVILCYITTGKDGMQRRMVDDVVLDEYSDGVIGKIKKRVCYANLTKYIINNNIDLLYIRSANNANCFIANMLKKVHSCGVKIIMEIPTYPYDGEFQTSSLKNRLRLKVDMISRRNMCRHIDYIATFTNYKSIFGVPTINISNGVDFDKIPVKRCASKSKDTINFIGVAEIHYWHGFDRMIKGMASYYKSGNRDVKVVFDIVGHGSKVDEGVLHRLTKDNSIEQYVIFHGTQAGDALDDLFDKADMGIGSLARHRSGITNIKTLKNREYAARGIPFVYSEADDDFDDMCYVLKVPADDSDIDITVLIDFCRGNVSAPQEIRDSIVETLSWKTIMKKVITLRIF